MSRYDIAIAYRIYPQVAKPAFGLPFSDNKLRLSEICLRSLKQSLGSLRPKVWVLLDHCPDDYADLFLKYFSQQDLILIRLPGIGNQATFGKQIDILLQQTDSDLVYFAEDDYVYVPNQFRTMVEFLQAYNDVDFVSPYDHLDCYNSEIHRFPKWVRVQGNHHWRTAASTCLTFLTRKRTLDRKRYIFRTYAWRNHDCSLWLSLTKLSLFNPVVFLRLAAREPLFAKMIAKAWLYGWPQIFFGKRMKLWVPVPALATHLDIDALSPSIDWIKMMKELADSESYLSAKSCEKESNQRELHRQGVGL
jgi:glycosyltransferase involved in cell wall biosynthesis